MSKLLTVFGSTGLQGSALINYILEHPELSNVFKLRGVTRDESKPAALALKEKGVEMVQADLDDLPSLVKAVSGSYSVFAMTNHWEKASADVEIAQGKATADACVAAGVTQIIWSSLPNVTLMSKGEITAAKHFDSKAVVEEYIRTLDIKSMFFMPGWFMQNNLQYMRPQLDAPGKYTWWPDLDQDSRLPLIDIRDTGKFIAPALLEPDVYNGKNFTCATRFYSAADIVEAWTKVTGKEVRHGVGGPVANRLSAELQDMLKETRGFLSVYAYFGPTGQEDLNWTLEQMTDKPTSWEQFIDDHQPWFEE